MLYFVAVVNDTHFFLKRLVDLMRSPRSITSSHSVAPQPDDCGTPCLPSYFSITTPVTESPHAASIKAATIVVTIKRKCTCSPKTSSANQRDAKHPRQR